MEDVEMTAEQKVKKQYPGVGAYYFGLYWRIESEPVLNGYYLSGGCETDLDAWADALRRIKAGGKA
jgi:hypothetical protein